MFSKTSKDRSFSSKIYVPLCIFPQKNYALSEKDSYCWLKEALIELLIF